MSPKSMLMRILPWFAVSACAFAIGACTTSNIDKPAPRPPVQRFIDMTAHGPAIGENTIADLAAEAMNSVVNIDTTTRVAVPGARRHFGFPFDLFGDESPMQRFEMKGTGSGVIIRADGYILTNNHVVGRATNIKVTLNDKRILSGTVVGRDAFTDLALVKVSATDLPVAKLGSAKKLRPGDWAIAIGSPGGLSNTVTLGIISALGRTLGQELGDVGLVQTDTAINPGNSGGPLLNIHGEVVGVNTAIKKDLQNIGFAIPVDLAKQVADQLIEKGAIKHPFVGIQMADLTDQINEALQLPAGTRGVVVAGVVPNSPADGAGLTEGDVIKDVDGQPVMTAKDVQLIVRKHQPGDKLTMGIERQGKSEQVQITVGDYPMSGNADE